MASSGRRLGVDSPAVPAHGLSLTPSAGQNDWAVESPISLKYPNGRVHETTLAMSGELRPGHRFELYGRHWNALHLLQPSRWKVDEPARMLCLTTSGPSETSRAK